MSFGMPVLAARRRGGGGIVQPYPELALLLSFEGADGSTDFEDISANGFEPTTYGTPTISNGYASSGSTSFHPVASGDYLEFADDDAFDFAGNPFAIGAYVKWTDRRVYAWLAGQRNGTLGDYDYWSILIDASGNVEVTFEMDGAATVGMTTTGGPVPSGAAHHLLVGRDSSGTFRLHIDGVLAKKVTGNTANCADYTLPLTIGASPRTTDYIDANLYGYIDDFFIINGANPWGSDASFTPPVAADLIATEITDVPTIASDSGFYGVGDTLTATAAPALGVGLTTSWQWKRGGVAISGATSISYTLVSGDLGANITVMQTESGASGSDSATSDAVGPVVTPAYTSNPITDSSGNTIVDASANTITDHSRTA